MPETFVVMVVLGLRLVEKCLRLFCVFFDGQLPVNALAYNTSEPCSLVRINSKHLL